MTFSLRKRRQNGPYGSWFPLKEGDIDQNWDDIEAAISAGLAPRADLLNVRIPPGIDSLRTSGYSSPGDGGGALYKRVDTEPAHEGKFPTADGAWWEIVELILNPRMFGGSPGATAAVNKTAMDAALSVGRVIYVPDDGTYTINSFALLSKSVIYGNPGSKLQFAVADSNGITASNITDFKVHDLELSMADGATKATQSAAIVVSGACSDFHLHDLLLSNCPDCGIRATGIASTGQVCERGLIERIRIPSSQGAARFNSGGVFVGEHTRDITVQDCEISSTFSYGIIFQNSQTTYHSIVERPKVFRNHIANSLAYGIAVYVARKALSVSATADNGSGLIRITTSAAHGLATGDEVGIESVGGTTEAIGLWLIDVVDTTNFDLRGSAYANAWTSGGTVVQAGNTDALIEGNHISDIDGAPTAQNGNNGNSGAGMYLVGIKNAKVTKNTIIRSNLGTTQTSLTPAAIGINGLYGAALVEGNVIEDCSWYGVYGVSSRLGSINVLNNAIRRSARTQVYMLDVNKGSVIGNDLIGKKATSTSTALIITATSATQKMVASNNNIVINGSTRPFFLEKITDLVCLGNNVLNEAGGGTTCELAYFSALTRGIISGNIFDGGASTFAALSLVGLLDTIIESNTSRMTDSVSVRPCVTMSGTCTGTIYGRSNHNSIARMENISTGGIMHTTDSVSTSGGKTRQNGDVIWDSAPAAGGTIGWVRAGGAAKTFGAIAS